MDKETFKSLIIKNNVRFMAHHYCEICNKTVGYYFDINPINNEVLATFDSSCDCGWSPQIPCPLENPAEWYDNLPNELKYF